MASIRALDYARMRTMGFRGGGGIRALPLYYGCDTTYTRSWETQWRVQGGGGGGALGARASPSALAQQPDQ